MSNYYVRREGDNSDYLEHALLGFSAKGGTVHTRSGSHKYIAKFNVGGRTRYIYDPRELAAFKAGGRAAAGAAKAVGGAVSNVRRKAGRFIDRNITGASAKKAYESDKRQKRELNRYNRSLFGRVENAGKRIANAGNNARKAMGKAAGDARRAGLNFAGSISKRAYDAVPGSVKRSVKKGAQQAGRAIDKYVTGASAKRGMNAEKQRWVDQTRLSERGAKAKRKAKASQKRWEDQSRRGGLGAQDRAYRAKQNTQTFEKIANSSAGAKVRAERAMRNSKAYEKRYRSSLFGRIDQGVDDATKFFKRKKKKSR